MTLSVVYVPDTGHVVGAVAETGTQAPADVAELVGPALPLRVAVSAGETAEGEPVVLALRDRQLAAFTADDEPDVFADPLAFGADFVVGADQVPVPKPALVRLAPWVIPLDLNDTGLTVTIPVASTTQDTTVVALVSDGPDTRVLTGAIAQGQTAVTLPAAVDVGPHGVLVLVAGWAGRLESVTKP